LQPAEQPEAELSVARLDDEPRRLQQQVALPEVALLEQAADIAVTADLQPLRLRLPPVALHWAAAPTQRA